jgi:uncharacterized protein YndB with AHSA1/START domain
MTARVVVAVTVAASPERCFAAFTGDIGTWWVDSPLFRLTPRSPGELAFEAPGENGQHGRLVERLASGKVFEVGKVSVWKPGERLVVGWGCATFGPEHATEVEVRFEPTGAGTRVTVEHRGWDSVPQEHVARHGFPLLLFHQRLGETWRDGLARLAGKVDHA